MLGRMLLHVVKAARPIYLASSLIIGHLINQPMNDGAIGLAYGDINNRDVVYLASVMRLTSRGRVEIGSVKDESETAVVDKPFLNSSFKLCLVGILII